MGCSFIAPIQRAVGKVVDVVLPVAAVIPGPWQVPAQIAMVVKAVDDGGIKNAIPAILSVAIGQVIPAGSVTGSIATDAAIKAATVAAVTGGDPLKSAALAALSSGLSKGSDTYSPAQPDNIFSDTTSSDVSGLEYTPDSVDYSLFSGDAQSNIGFQAPTQSISGFDGISPVDYGLSPSDLSGLQFSNPPVLGDSSSFINDPPVLSSPVLTEGLDAVNYSLDSVLPTENTGFQAPTQSISGWDGISPVDYGFTSSDLSGLQILNSPSLPSMGGGQGLTVPVEGGTVGALGLTPTNASPVLGNPDSFINDPDVLGSPVMAIEPPAGMTGEQQAELLKSIIGMFGSVGAAGGLMSSSASPQQQSFYQPSSTMPSYSPEYFQQVQQGYNRLLPSMPADVATPLSAWYNQPSSSIVSKLFGVI